MPHPRTALAVEQWPTIDRLAWDRANRDADPLDEPGLAAHWRPKSRHAVVTHYGLWLAWLRQTDRLDAEAAPTDRESAENLGAYVRHLRETGIASTTIANRIRNLREALRVMAPGIELGALVRVLHHVEALAEPTRSKATRIVSPALLVDAALAEMEQLAKRPDAATSRRIAERYRDALIIGFLAMRPIRLGNLASIELGRHLDRRGDRFWCQFSGPEMKNGEPLEFPLPALLMPGLSRYLEIHRPLLLRGTGDPHLWITIRVTPMSDNTINCRVRKVTERLIGRPINPHLFRDCAATCIAEFAPQEVRIVARILGHATLRTSTKSYNQAGMVSAQKRYAAELDRLRGDDHFGR